MKKQNETALSSKSKERIKLLLKFLFVAGLLYFLAKKGFISVQATKEALGQWQKILPAVGAMFFTSLLGIIRWRWLLLAQNIQLSWIKTFQLTYIGNFFNIALPGAVSGDFVKAYYVGQKFKGQRGKAFGSIVFDRVAGLSALVLVSAGALALGYHSYAHTPLFNAIQFMITIGALCVLFFYGYLFLVKENHDPILKIFRNIVRRVPKAQSLLQIYESLRNYHHHRFSVLKVLALSAIIQVALAWACLNFAEALGASNIELLSVLVVVPLGLLITAVPVAPAGVGTGNIAFLYFFHLLGNERGADVYSLFALTNLIIGSLGGIVYFRFRNHDEMPGTAALYSS